MEIWKPIPSHRGYEASTLGRIRGIDRVIRSKRWASGHQSRAGKILKPICHGKGNYLCVTVGQPRRRAFVHVLVLEAFIGPRPNRADCCHRDGNPRNNVPQNLYWGSRSENVQDAIRHGTKYQPPRISEVIVQQVLQRRPIGYSYAKIACDLHIGTMTAWRICKRRLVG